MDPVSAMPDAARDVPSPPEDGAARDVSSPPEHQAPKRVSQRTRVHTCLMGVPVGTSVPTIRDWVLGQFKDHPP